MIWQSIEAVLIIFIMIGAGIFVSWRGWVSREVAKVFPKLVIYLTLPCMIITSFSENFTQQALFDSWLPIAVIFVIVPVSFFVGRLFAALFRVGDGFKLFTQCLDVLVNDLFIEVAVELFVRIVQRQKYLPENRILCHCKQFILVVEFHCEGVGQ